MSILALIFHEKTLFLSEVTIGRETYFLLQLIVRLRCDVLFVKTPGNEVARVGSRVYFSADGSEKSFASPALPAW